jgi:hypothetical protein
MATGAPKLQLCALKIIGSLLIGNDGHCDKLLGLGVLQVLINHLNSNRRALCATAAWALSNITAGTPQQVDAVLDVSHLAAVQDHPHTGPPLAPGQSHHGNDPTPRPTADTTHALPRLLQLLQYSSDYEVRKECLWTLCNATMRGRSQTVVNMANAGFFPVCLRILASSSHTKMIILALEGLDNIFRKAMDVDRKNEEHAFYNNKQHLQQPTHVWSSSTHSHAATPAAQDTGKAAESSHTPTGPRRVSREELTLSLHGNAPAGASKYPTNVWASMKAAVQQLSIVETLDHLVASSHHPKITAKAKHLLEAYFHTNRHPSTSAHGSDESGYILPSIDSIVHAVAEAEEAEAHRLQQLENEARKQQLLEQQLLVEQENVRILAEEEEFRLRREQEEANEKQRRYEDAVKRQEQQQKLSHAEGKAELTRKEARAAVAKSAKSISSKMVGSILTSSVFDAVTVQQQKQAEEDENRRRQARREREEQQAKLNDAMIEQEKQERDHVAAVKSSAKSLSSKLVGNTFTKSVDTVAESQRQQLERQAEAERLRKAAAAKEQAEKEQAEAQIKLAQEKAATAKAKEQEEEKEETNRRLRAQDQERQERQEQQERLNEAIQTEEKQARVRLVAVSSSAKTLSSKLIGSVVTNTVDTMYSQRKQEQARQEQQQKLSEAVEAQERERKVRFAEAVSSAKSMSSKLVGSVISNTVLSLNSQKQQSEHQQVTQQEAQLHQELEARNKAQVEAEAKAAAARLQQQQQQQRLEQAEVELRLRTAAVASSAKSLSSKLVGGIVATTVDANTVAAQQKQQQAAAAVEAQQENDSTANKNAAERSQKFIGSFVDTTTTDVVSSLLSFIATNATNDSNSNNDTSASAAESENKPLNGPSNSQATVLSVNVVGSTSISRELSPVHGLAILDKYDTENISNSSSIKAGIGFSKYANEDYMEDSGMFSQLHSMSVSLEASPNRSASSSLNNTLSLTADMSHEKRLLQLQGRQPDGPLSESPASPSMETSPVRGSTLFSQLPAGEQAASPCNDTGSVKASMKLRSQQNEDAPVNRALNFDSDVASCGAVMGTASVKESSTYQQSIEKE